MTVSRESFGLIRHHSRVDWRSFYHLQFIPTCIWNEVSKSFLSFWDKKRVLNDINYFFPLVSPQFFFTAWHTIPIILRQKTRVEWHQLFVSTRFTAVFLTAWHIIHIILRQQTRVEWQKFSFPLVSSHDFLTDGHITPIILKQQTSVEWNTFQSYPRSTAGDMAFTNIYWHNMDVHSYKK